MKRDHIISFATTQELAEIIYEKCRQLHMTPSTFCHQFVETILGEEKKEDKNE